eukprot:1752870-Prymnesium_polylepis.2
MARSRWPQQRDRTEKAEQQEAGGRRDDRQPDAVIELRRLQPRRDLVEAEREPTGCQLEQQDAKTQDVKNHEASERLAMAADGGHQVVSQERGPRPPRASPAAA